MTVDGVATMRVRCVLRALVAARGALVAFALVAVVVGGCAHPPKPTVSGGELYARLDTLLGRGRVELTGSNQRKVLVKYGQILVTEDARQMFAIEALVATCTGRAAEEPETCTLALYRDQRFRVYNQEPVHLARTAEEDEEADGLSAGTKLFAAFIVTASALGYGMATCEFDNCKTLFGVGIGFDLFLFLLLMYGFAWPWRSPWRARCSRVAAMTVLVLDFDGTMTDAEAEGRPFRDGYLEDLCLLVGKPLGDPEVLAIANEVEHELLATPGKHPFLWMGRPVAPATVDPYLRMVPIAHRILDRFGVMPSAVDRGRLLGSVLYKYNYQKTLGHPVFRAGAGEALRSLADRDTWIVTNSDTHAVAGKVAALDRETPGVAWLTSRVRGHARKFDVDDEWDGAEAELALPDLDRPVLLRRRSYHDILKTILDDAGAAFSDLVVVGDIFELDLAMPLSLGARVGLVASTYTPAYERAFVDVHPRGRVIEDLSEIKAFAFG